MNKLKKLFTTRDELIAEGKNVLRENPPASNLSVQQVGYTLSIQWKAHQTGTIKFQILDESRNLISNTEGSECFLTADLMAESISVTSNTKESVRLIASVGGWTSQPLSPKNLDEKKLPVEIFTNRKDMTKRLGQIAGVEEVDDKVRVYFWNATVLSAGPGVYYTESNDLMKWSDPKPIKLNGHPKEGKKGFFPRWKEAGIFYHKGWKAVSEAGTWVLYFESEDGITFHFIKSAYEKEGQEGLPQPFFKDGKYHFYDRWRRDDIEEYAVRGVSYISIDEDQWGKITNKKPKLIADPREIFDWSGHEKFDIYAAQVGPDVAFPSVFFKDDRRDPVRNKEGRITGPVHPVHAKVDGKNFEITSLKSPVPLEPHMRVWDGPNPTSEELEVGQMHAFPKLIRRDGVDYIFYFYREDPHYESRDDDRHLYGIFMNRYQED